MQYNRKYRIIAQHLIQTLPEFEEIRSSEVKIAYLASNEEKKQNHRIIFADCNLVSKRYKWCCDYDFFIVIYEPNVIEFNDSQLETLIRHELHHVGIDYSGDEMKYYVAPHDIEEFRQIIDECGLDWSDMNAERGKSE